MRIRKGNDHQGLDPVPAGIAAEVPAGYRNGAQRVAEQRVRDNEA